MAKTKTTSETTPTPKTKWSTDITFVIGEAQAKKLAEWKAAHNTIFGVCDEDEYDYVFNTDGEDYSVVVRNTLHDTEIDLTDETSW
jgi:hypothetical protein